LLQDYYNIAEGGEAKEGKVQELKSSRVERRKRGGEEKKKT
jgi:hypothetical protein